MPALSCLGILGIQAWVNGFRLVGCKAGNGHVERMVARVGKECLHLRHHRHKQRPMCATAYWLRHDACCSATRLCAAAVLLPAAACVRRPGCLHAATARRCQSTNGCSEQHLTRATFYIIPVPLFLLPCPLPHAAAAARFVAPISFFAAGVPLHACMHASYGMDSALCPVTHMPGCRHARQSRNTIRCACRLARSHAL